MPSFLSVDTVSAIPSQPTFEKTGSAAVARCVHGIRLLALAIAVSTVSACTGGSTEVVLDVYTDIDCDVQAAVAAGKPGELGNRSASAVSMRCDEETGALGRLVIVPSDGDEGELAVEVRLRADRGAAESCLEASGYLGCIVARRIVSYIPGRSINMRVDLKNPCVNTPCSQTTTCVAQGLNRACVEAKVDPTICNGPCRDEDLLVQGGTFDPCGAASNPCDASATCLVREQGVICACPNGFTNDARNKTKCVDLDECSAEIHDCDRNASCSNTEGGFGCECLPGYEGDGRQCEQSECSAPCDPNATCRVSQGKYECVCNAGYDGSGVACEDVDECATDTHDCAPEAICENRVGGFDCSCPEGASVDPTDASRCVDLDECATQADACDRHASCTNTEGGFECSCLPGYRGDGFTCEQTACTAPCADHATCVQQGANFACVCDSGFEGDGFSCSDVDECAGVNDCIPPALCSNDSGGYSCDCPEGFEPDASGCRDLDECRLGTHDCVAPAMCRNTQGTFVCDCPSGFASTNQRCIDVDECSSGTHDCIAPAMCRNELATFSCDCPMGYIDDGRSCADIDECQSIQCPQTHVCENLPGSWSCAPCPSGSIRLQGTCVPDTTNLARSAVASATSTFSGYSPAFANDGNATTVQSSDESWTNENLPLPQAFYLEFPERVTFSRIEIFTSEGFPIQAYDIDISDSSPDSTATWIPIVTMAGNLDLHLSHSVSSVEAKSIRVLGHRGPQHQSQYVRLNEVEVYYR
jgi:hypothetical protein